MEIIRNLLSVLDIQTPPGVTAAELAAFEQQTGLTLPESVRALYAHCNGAILNKNILEILPLAGVQEYVENFRQCGIPQRWGYFPFTENNDSNPFCVCCNAPLAGYIVQVHHDDIAALKFRSLDSFMTALLKNVREDKWNLDSLPSEFEYSDRTARDIEAGHELLQIASGLEDVEQRDAFRFGMWLLPEAKVNEIAPLLEYEDEYVRQDTIQRLTALPCVEAKEALRKANDSFREFVSRCAEALKRAGIQSTIVNERWIRLDAGPTWLSMESFYVRHKDPTVFDFVVQRSRFLLSQQKKD